MLGWYNICKSTNVTQHTSRIKDKTHIIIPIDAGKSLQQNSARFCIKVLKKTEIKEHILEIPRG
jgi:hypothetical protein